MARTVSIARTLLSPSMRFWVWILSTAATIEVYLLVVPKPFGWRHWTMAIRVHHVVRAHDLAGIALALTVMFVACGCLLSQMVLVRARVYNARTPHIFEKRELPGFVSQGSHSDALARFRLHLDDVLRVEYPDSLSKAIAIRRWVRVQQSQDQNMWLTPVRINHEDPHRLLAEQKEGVPGSCRRFSYILLGALLSAGYDARIVGFANSLRRRGRQRHTAVEVWLEELEQWVLLDATHDTLLLIDGKVASAIELHEAIVDGDLSRIAFERDGAALEPHPKVEFYACYCRHLFVAMSNAVFDGYAVRMVGRKRISFLHYSREGPYPELLRQVLLGTGGSGLFLSLLLWSWSLVSLAAE